MSNLSKLSKKPASPTSSIIEKLKALVTSESIKICIPGSKSSERASLDSAELDEIEDNPDVNMNLDEEDHKSDISGCERGLEDQVLDDDDDTENGGDEDEPEELLERPVSKNGNMHRLTMNMSLRMNHELQGA